MWWSDFSLREKILEALTWSAICGNGYLKATWDPYANKPMTFMVGPDGNPITDESLKTIFSGGAGAGRGKRPGSDEDRLHGRYLTLRHYLRSMSS